MTNKDTTLLCEYTRMTGSPAWSTPLFRLLQPIACTTLFCIWVCEEDCERESVKVICLWLKSVSTHHIPVAPPPPPLLPPPLVWPFSFSSSCALRNYPSHSSPGTSGDDALALHEPSHSTWPALCGPMHATERINESTLITSFHS